MLRKDGPAALQYAASEGYGPLREMVAAMLPWKVDPAQVLITTGSQQGLDLVAKVLIDAGSRVLVETPTYLGALAGLRADGARGRQRGQRRRRRDRRRPRRPRRQDARFVYLLPNFQNPTGRTMTEAAPRRAVRSAPPKLGLPIVEDNPYGDLWFDAPPPLPLTARNPEGCIYLGSFSKVLAPGLRLGFLVAPKSIYPKLLQAKQAADLHSPELQPAHGRRGDEGRLPAIATCPPSARSTSRQRDAMLARATARDARAWTCSGTQPDGGMFLWARLPRGHDTVELLPKAVDSGVAFVPGAPFYAGAGDPRTLRLSFVTASVEQIDTAIAALAEVVREQLAHNAAAEVQRQLAASPA